MRKIVNKERIILISDHAIDRIGQRLGWSMKLCSAIISEACFEAWDVLMGEKLQDFYLISKGVKWGLSIQGEKTLILTTVVLYKKSSSQNRLRRLITKYITTVSFLQRNKLRKEIFQLSREIPTYFFRNNKGDEDVLIFILNKETN